MESKPIYKLIIVSFITCICVLGQTSQDCDCSCWTAEIYTEQGEQGQSGKIGPAGSPGPIGPQGPSGLCACNPNEIQRLIRLIQDLTRRMEVFYTSDFTQFLPIKFFIDNCLMGVKSGSVADSQMSASSEFPGNYANQGRLDYNGSRSPFRSGSWSALHKRPGEWLQVDLLHPLNVTGIITQGRKDRLQWITEYKVAFANNTNSFQFVTDTSGRDMVFSGNTDQNTYVMNRFPQPITARYFRLVSEQSSGYVSARLDYTVC